MNQHAAWTVLNKHSGFLPSLPPKKLLQPVAPVKSLQVLIIWCPRLQQWKRFDILLTFCSKSVPFFPTQRHGVRRPEVIGWQSEACETIWLSHIAYWNNFLIYIIYIIIYNWHNHCTLPDRVLFTWLVVESDLSIISYTKTSWWNRRWLFVISKSSQCIWGRNLWSLWSQRSNVRTSAGGASNSGWFLFWSHWGLHRIRITLSSRDVGNPGCRCEKTHTSQSDWIWLFVDWVFFFWVWTPGSRTGEGVHWPGGWRQSQGGSEVFTSWLTVPPWDRQTPEKMSGCPSWWLGPGPESSWAYTSQHSVVCKSI